jgi:hypothetical protein
MATRPLDAAFGGSTTKKSKKRGAILAVGIVAGLASIGSIFAASFTVNGDGNILFSQGTTTIAACDPDGIQASLGAFYSSAFQIDTVQLTGVDGACDGQRLTLAFYDGTTKLAEVSGQIKIDESTIIEIGLADNALSTAFVNQNAATETVLEGTPTVTYESTFTAANVAADADRIVIEIN